MSRTEQRQMVALLDTMQRQFEEVMMGTLA